MLMIKNEISKVIDDSNRMNIEVIASNSTEAKAAKNRYRASSEEDLLASLSIFDQIKPEKERHDNKIKSTRILIIITSVP
mmetsp:Transcript_1316/g.1888  ORF Transcript_1316/g.1888 Transcript_1316/m.1888 type:complete len:80 (-) Transcript_1316:1098-1337(-)